MLWDTQRSILRFVHEARECAALQLGLACLSTLFSVVLAVAEAICPGQANDEQVVEVFVMKMPDKTSWLAVTPPPPSDSALAKLLTDVRNAMAHQLSLPSHVLLAKSNEEAALLSVSKPGLVLISTTGLTKAVGETAEDLVRSYPSALFDPRPRSGPRSPADRLESAFLDLGLGFSASASGSPDAVPPRK